MTDEQLAGKLYSHYCIVVGGKAYDGKPLPAWDDFRDDPKKRLQSNAWIEVAKLAHYLIPRNN